MMASGTMAGVGHGRRRISMEDLRRAALKPSDLLIVLRGLITALPRPWLNGFLIVALPAAEVGSQVAIALVGKSFLGALMAPEPRIPWWLLVAAAVLAGLFFLVARARQRTQERIMLLWQGGCVRRLSHNIARASYEDLSAVPMAELREIVMTDAPFMTRYFVETAGQLAVLGLWFLAASAVLASMAPPLLAVLGSLIILFTLGMAIAVRAHLQLTQERFRRLADMSEHARDLAEVERAMMARQFGLGDRFVRLFLVAHKEHAAISLRQSSVAATVRASILTMNALSFLGVIGVGGVMIVRHGLEPAALLVALFVIGQMLAALAQLSELAGKTAEATTAGRRLAAYWSDIRPAHAASEPAAPLTTLETRNLGFAYAGSPAVIQGLDLRLERGRPVALSARTGAGKSTLALLLTGILEPGSGDVVLEGRSEFTPEALSPGRVLYVGPKPILVAGDIATNLFGGDPSDPVVRPIWDELERSSPGILAEPALIGPGGTGVSSGQGQLVQLARAVLRDPEIIVFDEATSALDMETEARVQAALLPWIRARICLVISHRPCPWLDEAAHRLRW